jgi:TPR repeat protein
MNRPLVLLTTLIALAAVANPSDVIKKPVAGYPSISLYELPSAQTLPSFWASFFKLFGIPSAMKLSLPFQRSVAVLVGIGHYQFITPRLEYVSRDVEKMRDYLLGDGGFDAVYVMDESVSPDVVETFMSDRLRTILGPDDRLLFYYSGHGADPGTKHPVLQFQQAKPNQWGQNVLRVDEFEQWSGLFNIKHALFIFDACTAGQAAVAKGSDADTTAAVTELSAGGSRIVVTAGTADQQAWVVKVSSDNQYSIFTDALLRVLREGTADRGNRGFITIGQAVNEAEVLLAGMTLQLGPGHTMNPSLKKIDEIHTGNFVFLNPHAIHPQMPMADERTMGISDAKGISGSDFDKEADLAYWKSIDSLDDRQLYEKYSSQFPNGMFIDVARKRLKKMEIIQSTAAPTQDLRSIAVDQLKSLAESGSRDALTQLGKAFEAGLQGAPVDLATSIQFYKRASVMGDRDASCRIGMIYFYGRRGVAKDDTKAAVWFRKAADAGDSRGMDYLAFMYGNGKGGLPKDDLLAVHWYSRAAESGDGSGMANIGTAFQYGRGGLPKDELKAVSWYRKAIDAGDGSGMFSLGSMYLNGQGGLPTDEVEALRWFRKAAEAGVGQAMTGVGAMYENGRGGLTKDDVKAVSWYRKASDAGDGSGMYDLGLMYLNGRGGLPTDEAKALRWFQKAADAGVGQAITSVGALYENGAGGLPRDEVEAVKWYRKAIDAGESRGMAYLGVMYENGRGGLPKDHIQAVTWYRKAAQSGDNYAQEQLRRLGLPD